MVSETFEGTVDRLDGALAFITFTDARGCDHYAAVDMAKLTAAGIGVGDDFLLTLAQEPPSLRFERLPRRELTEAELAEIRAEAALLEDA